MSQKFKDNARALLAGSITNVATTLTVEAGKADRFPVGNTSSWGSPVDWFKAVLIDSAGNREVIKVGTRTLGSGVFGNMLRAQDGTTALAFTAGAVVIAPIFAADVENILAGIYAGTITQQGVAVRGVPVGGITMWSGAIAAIPAGWALCDGTNGTPDLRDRFVIGAASDASAVAKTNVTGALTQAGGSKDATLPVHSHTASSSFSGNALGAHGHSTNESPHVHFRGESVGDQIVGAGGLGAKLRLNNQSASNTDAATTGITINTTSAGTPSGSVGTTVDATGGSATNANLPPYYALAFIQCLA